MYRKSHEEAQVSHSYIWIPVVCVNWSVTQVAICSISAHSADIPACYFMLIVFYQVLHIEE